MESEKVSAPDGPPQEPGKKPKVPDHHIHIRVKFEHEGPLGLDIASMKSSVVISAAPPSGSMAHILRKGDMLVAVQGRDVSKKVMKEVKMTIGAHKARPIWLDFLRPPPPSSPVDGKESTKTPPADAQPLPTLTEDKQKEKEKKAKAEKEAADVAARKAKLEEKKREAEAAAATEVARKKKEAAEKKAAEKSAVKLSKLEPKLPDFTPESTQKSQAKPKPATPLAKASPDGSPTSISKSRLDEKPLPNFSLKKPPKDDVRPLPVFARQERPSNAAARMERKQALNDAIEQDRKLMEEAKKAAKDRRTKKKEQEARPLPDFSPKI